MNEQEWLEELFNNGVNVEYICTYCDNFETNTKELMLEHLKECEKTK